MTTEQDHLTDLPPVLPFAMNAQQLAFAPIAFQVAKVLRDTGILREVEQSRGQGITTAELAEKLPISAYGITVLLEGGLGIELVRLKEDRWSLTKTGNFILNDRMTRINMDFVHDVCYEGSFKLDEAIEKGTPAGLKVFGEWKTVYEGLSKLPNPVQKSWFDFDHFYSDGAFPDVLPIVFKNKPSTLLDVGGNTGKWSLQCLRHDPDVKVTILDLPGQLEVAKTNVAEAGLSDRWTGHPIDLLDSESPFPKGNEAIWMSQFLCCFSEPEIVSILRRAHDAMDENSTLFILDTYWDKQESETASYCLQMSSIYFTCIANGNSRMYSSDVMKKCIEEANLMVVEESEILGQSHTLFQIKKRD